MARQRKTTVRPPNAPANSREGPVARTQAAAAAAAAAAGQRQQQVAADIVLLLLLQHDSIRTQLSLACKLLCCSKWLAAAVAEHCTAQLDIPQSIVSTPAWLRKHTRLVRSLDLQMANSATSGIVPALMAAGPQTLALQSLIITANATTLPLLEQLPASRLTQLELWVDEPSAPADRPAIAARVSAALGRLTALRSLGLFMALDQQELPGGLSGLTQLTSLHLHGPPSNLQHVPPQLLELNISDAWREPGQPLDLRHLAAATALCIGWLEEGDALPPNLLTVQVTNCRSAQPLQGLVQLQQLELRFGFASAGDISTDQLRQLSRLTALSLHYRSLSAEPASAAAWLALPLQQLELHQASLSGPVCQHLAQLSGLTSLRLQQCRLPQPGSAQQLAAALRRMSGLQQLKLSQPRLVAGDEATAEPSQGVQQLAQAVGSLKRLRELDIRRFSQLAAAAGVGSSLTALTALTALFVSRYSDGLTDAGVTAIVSQLPGLRSLVHL